MDQGAFAAERARQGGWLAGALWRGRAAILMSTAALAGTAFGLASLGLAEAPTTRLVIVQRGSAPAGPVAGSLGEAVAAAGGALGAGFKASSDLLAGRDVNRPAADRLADILREVPAGSGLLLTDRRGDDFLRTAREIAAPGGAGSTAPRILADMTLPIEPGLSLAMPIAALAGLAGLLGSSFAVAATGTKARRRRVAENRWDASGEDAAWGPAAAEGVPASPAVAIPDRSDPQLDLDREAVSTPSVEADAPVARTLDLSNAGEGEGEASISAAAATQMPAFGEAMPVDRDGGATPSLETQAGEGAATQSVDDREAMILELPRLLSAKRAIEAEDLAEAALAVGVRTLLMVEANETLRTCGSVDLVRALAGRGATSILLDLGFDRVIANDLGIEESAAGLSDLLVGTVDTAAIIHRDVASKADAIVWGRDALETVLHGGRLADLFASLGAVYDCIVISGGDTPLRSLVGLLGNDGAAVVSMSPGGFEAAEARQDDLAACGEAQSLLMAAYPRHLHLIAEAA